MNPLARYGIDHLSPSSLNLWRASPGLWSARYLAGFKDESAATWRGHAVEAAFSIFFSELQKFALPRRQVATLVIPFHRITSSYNR